MTGLVVGFIVLIALAVLFIWLATRAWRIKPVLPRLLAGIISSLLALVFIVVTVFASVGVYRFFYASPSAHKNVESPGPVTGTQDQVARGQQIAVLCAGCHSSTGDLPLDGSGEDFMAGGPPLGTLYAPNLTPSGPIKDWTDAQVIRAIREGVDNQGRPLVIMPSDGFHGMSDADAQAVVAYLRSQPASPRLVPLPSFNVIGYAILGSGVFPTSEQPPLTEPVNAPQRGATAEYGHYLTTAFACQSCHGPNLEGSSEGGFGPPAPNLKQIVPGWSEAGFLKFFQTGVAPSGIQIDPENMPWREYSKVLSNEDLQAIYLYLHGSPGGD